jgi:hypothetical protein
VSDSENPNDRPTLNPPFDFAAFAKETDSALRPGRPSELPTLPPPNANEHEPSSDCVPWLIVSREDLAWFDFSDLTRAVLDRVDGRKTVRALVQGTGLQRDAVMRALRELCEQHVLAFY